MSGVVLLCILPEGAEPAAASPAHALALPPLSLWVRPADHPPGASLEEVRAHHALVAAAWSAHPAVLPVRFGQWFASAGALADSVAPRLDAYRNALERVRDRAEFSVRILDPGRAAPPEPAAASGTAYLRAAAARERRRAEAEARGRAVAAELRAELGALVSDERVDPFPTPHGLAAVAHLVARDRAAGYEAAVQAFAAARPALRFLRTGPWPAWSFTA